MLFVSETFYPGWACAVDGKPEDIQPVLGAFRSVRVGPTATQVEFYYQPRSVKLGVFLSLLSLGGAALCAGWMRSRRRART